MTFTVDKAVCRECGEVQEIPAVAKCAECESNKLARVDPMEEPLRDTLAELDILLQDNATHRERILAAISKVTFVLGEMRS
jgi:primosomal protein N'